MNCKPGKESFFERWFRNEEKPDGHPLHYGDEDCDFWYVGLNNEPLPWMDFMLPIKGEDGCMSGEGGVRAKRRVLDISALRYIARNYSGPCINIYIYI